MSNIIFGKLEIVGNQIIGAKKNFFLTSNMSTVFTLGQFWTRTRSSPNIVSKFLVFINFLKLHFLPWKEKVSRDRFTYSIVLEFPSSLDKGPAKWKEESEWKGYVLMYIVGSGVITRPTAERARKERRRLSSAYFLFHTPFF